VDQPGNRHVDIRKALERKTQLQETLTKLKTKVHADTFAHSGEFGASQAAVVRGHHHLKSTPRSNILYAARMIQAKSSLE